jgi:anaphase-promoting complex subunit 1
LFSFQEYIPRGRKICDDHPGPLFKKHDNIPNEFVLLDRMQNVNLSKDENFHETWSIREVFQHSTISSAPEELAFLNPPTVNSEEELYYRGNTAVYSSGLTDESNEKASAVTCYTSERPIQFAFLCSKNFLDANYKTDAKPSRRLENEEVQGVGWNTRLSILLEKEASSTSIEGNAVPMPKFFSLAHPLDDMYPVLLKIQGSINYITEEEYKVRHNISFRAS